MATPPRYFQQGAYYHVFNRGNRKQKIFLHTTDYCRFIEKLTLYKNKFPITILAYCLMPNHFHFLLRQDSFIPVSALMLRIGTSYSKYFNLKYNQVGSLFQGPFKAKIVDSDAYLLHLSRYIHRNPILTPRVELQAYPWSSYELYIKRKKTRLVDPLYILDYFAKKNATQDYKQFVEYDISSEMFKNEDFF